MVGSSLLSVVLLSLKSFSVFLIFDISPRVSETFGQSCLASDSLLSA